MYKNVKLSKINDNLKIRTEKGKLYLWLDDERYTISSDMKFLLNLKKFIDFPLAPKKTETTKVVKLNKETGKYEEVYITK
jgi:hypothetical protein